MAAEEEVLIAGRYRLVDRIGSGGMSTVWEAWDERLHRRVAVKQLRLQQGLAAREARLAANRTMREARITARLHHPHAVTVYDIVTDGDTPCLVMQFVSARSLQAVLDDRHDGSAMNPQEVARIGSEVASALVAAHDAGIVHRDVKPGNILIDDSGSARITDFGISHAIGDVTLTSTGLVTGTPAYLAPEAARGEESGYPADVFSLGATLFAALEGAPPVGRSENPMSVLHQVASGKLNPPKRITPLTPLLQRMLALAPAERPAMTEVRDTLAELARTGGADSPTEPAPPVEPLPPSTTVMLPPAGDRDAGTDTPPDRDRDSRGPAATVGLAGPAGGRPAAAPPRSSPQSPPRSASQLPPEKPGPTRPAPPVGGPPPRRRARGPLAVLAIVAALLVLGGVVVLLISLGGNGRDNVGAGDQSSAAPPRTTTPSSTSQSARQVPPAHQHSPSTHSSSSSSSPPSSSSTSTSTSSGGTSGQDPVSAVVDYYALLPDDTSDAWPRLTPSYQQHHAGGRQGYDNFWKQFHSVSTSDTHATGASSVETTLTYTYQNGRTDTEVTDFDLVDDGGTLKIADSRVVG